ncbi:MAG: aminotransferase class III-fold pyridoxal phosphate-dependent enzyme, partial [Anaerovibrio sp.]|nr:aminotransferase class III-fold pyridoxal phosphate-dependent enzyme [Anaerovibrio sp.]
AFIASDKVAAVFHAGDHGSTFGGNPLACAAANVVLDIVGEDKFLADVEAMGNYMKARLEKLKKKFPQLIAEVRGMGLILGMELTRPGRDIVNSCLEKGAIINCTAGNVLRFVPPLIVTKEHIDEVCDILESVLPDFA